MLTHQLWEIFSPKLIKKYVVINLLSQITLSHGESYLPSPQILLSYIYKSRRNPIPIYIIYKEPNKISTQLTTSNYSLLNPATQPIFDLNLLSTQRRTPHSVNDRGMMENSAQHDLLDVAQYSKMSMLLSAMCMKLGVSNGCAKYYHCAEI
ncbi:alphaK I8 [Puccinia sorghi]|uniref:AlphaK I8 n=1 Tax=Puccinia sorghi TaxID=27349 RepID=A0A0L6VTT4_9BASI|nr:alphaK I8 [Puccinia sorghi]